MRTTITTMVAIGSVLCSMTCMAATPPSAVGPIPSKEQMNWHQKEMLMFCHFGIKTYYPNKNHMGSGKEDPAKFHPAKLDASQWLEAAKAGGFKGIVLTTKHHDGFCTWQTATTDFSVKTSPWKDGKGDVVRELADACHAAGMWLGLYLSAYDLHYLNSSEDKAVYGSYYEKQLTELCSNYGVINELWFDGFGSKNMTVNRNNLSPIIRKHQPNVVIFDSGLVPDMPQSTVRWPGNENGSAGDPNWSIHPAPDKDLNVKKDARWYPLEADTIAQGNWFWNNAPICSLERLQEIYSTSVGHGAVALINVPPNQDGLIDQASIARLAEFKKWVDGIYDRDAAPRKKASASSIRGNDASFGPEKAVDNNYDTYWTIDDGVTNGYLEVDLGKPVDIDGVIIQEYIPLGQRIAAHRVEFMEGSEWREAVSSTTIGYKRIHWKKFNAQRVRLMITRSRASPLVNSFRVIQSAPVR